MSEQGGKNDHNTQSGGLSRRRGEKSSGKKPWSWKRHAGKMIVRRETAWQRKLPGTTDDGGLLQRLSAAWDRRRIYIAVNKLEAFRLATREELWVPVGVDVYGAMITEKNGRTALAGGRAVLQIYDEFLPEGMLEGLKKLLVDQFGLEGFYEKKRFRAKESPEAGGALEESPVELIVGENGHRFIVNLNNYLDTGLFLDHRETRKRVERMVREMKETSSEDEAMVEGIIENPVAENTGKPDAVPKAPVVLNLFAYSGSFSVYAAGGGAGATHTVDLSKTYCDWARRNFELNGMPLEKHWIYRMETFEFYRYAARKGLCFDLIIIDPPTFSRAKDSIFSVEKDHVRLLKGAIPLLNERGVIVFSNNCLDFQMDSQINELFEVRDIQHETVPQDFWIDTISQDFWSNRNQIHNCFLLKLKHKH